MENITLKEDYYIKVKEYKLPNGIDKGFIVSLCDDDGKLYVSEVTTRETFLKVVDKEAPLSEQIKEWGTKMTSYIGVCSLCSEKGYIPPKNYLRLKNRKKACIRCLKKEYEQLYCSNSK